jgi:hypothetical protein
VRDYPDPDRQIRENFEALRDDLRNKKIGIATNSASAAYLGFSIGGPVGAAIGGALGTLIGYWSYKSYRSQVYAAYAEAGLVRRPKRRIRSIFYQDPSDPAFVRYPHSELVGDVVLEVLTSQNPWMPQSEVNKAAYDIVRTFDVFRRDNPDIPIELAAEVILMVNGIMRNPETGAYEKVEIQDKPEPLPDVMPDRTPDRTPDKRQSPNAVAIAWALAGVAVFIYLLRGRG